MGQGQDLRSDLGDQRSFNREQSADTLNAARRAEEISGRQAFETSTLKSRQSFEERMQQQADASRKEMAGLKSQVGDAGQREQMLDAKLRVLGLRDSIRDGSSTLTPEQVREAFEESLEVQDLSPEGRATVIEFYMSKVEPLLKAQEDEAQRLEDEANALDASETENRERLRRNQEKRRSEMSDIGRKALDRGGFFGSSKF